MWSDKEMYHALFSWETLRNNRERAWSQATQYQSGLTWSRQERTPGLYKVGKSPWLCIDKVIAEMLILDEKTVNASGNVTIQSFADKNGIL